MRQPLREAVIVADGREREAIERLAELVRDELNVTALRFVEAADELGTYTRQAQLPRARPALRQAHAELVDASRRSTRPRSRARCATARRVVVSFAGADHELGADDLTLAMAPLEGYLLEREGSHAVALELALDDELIRAGHAREIVHAIQQLRRDAGLEITDRIELALGGDGELLDAAREHERLHRGRDARDRASPTTSATAGDRAVAIDGRELGISLARRRRAEPARSVSKSCASIFFLG